MVYWLQDAPSTEGAGAVSTERDESDSMSIEEYRAIVSELMDELPAEFFRELTGGVVVSDALMIPDYARGDDICTLGEYRVYSGMRQIVMYKGSFDRMYPRADGEEARQILRGILRHEFRHHVEYLGGVHNASSLEAEDARKKQEYLASHIK